MPFARRRVIEGTDQEPTPDENDDARYLVVNHSWRCVEQAERAMQDAEQRGAPADIVDGLGARYTQAIAEYARYADV